MDETDRNLKGMKLNLMNIDEDWRTLKLIKIDENWGSQNWWKMLIPKNDETLWKRQKHKLMERSIYENSRNQPKLKIDGNLMKIDEAWSTLKFMKIAEAQNWWNRPIPKSDGNLRKQQKLKLTKHKLMKIDETNRDPKLMKLMLRKIDEYWGRLKFMKHAKA